VAIVRKPGVLSTVKKRKRGKKTIYLLAIILADMIKVYFMHLARADYKTNTLTRAM